MNSSPTILRFSSGSETPASRVRKRFCACTWTSGTWKWPPNVSTTCSASFSRSSPWSTKTHVSWSPTALCTRSAATAESTPPESAQSTRSEPTAARIRATCSSMTAAGVHVGGVPGDLVEEVLEDLLPVRRVHDLGVELDAVQPPRPILEGGDRRRRRGGRDLAPPRVEPSPSRDGSSTRSARAGGRGRARTRPPRARPCRTRTRPCARRRRRGRAP